MRPRHDAAVNAEIKRNPPEFRDRAHDLPNRRANNETRPQGRAPEHAARTLAQANRSLSSGL
jgi:hypothetical protein